MTTLIGQTEDQVIAAISRWYDGLDMSSEKAYWRLAAIRDWMMDRRKNESICRYCLKPFAQPDRSDTELIFCSAVHAYEYEQATKPRDIIVEVEGGLVESVQNIPAGCRVIVRDGDTDGGSSEYLVEIDGEEYYQTVFEADGNMTPGDGGNRFLNYYSHCGHEWNEPSSHTGNDHCPVCGAEITPDKSEDIKPCA